MAESTVVYTPDNNGGSIPAWMAMNNGGLFGGNGWGGGILGFFLGLLFGNGWGGFGGFGNGFGGGAGAGFLSNQINNDNGRDLLMQAITSQGEAARTATQSLSTMLGQDFNLVNGAIQTLQSSLSTLKTTMVQEFCAAKERDMQEKIDGLLAANSTLRGQIDNANQTAAITSYVNSLVSPIAKEVDDIKCKMPQTVPVTWPNLAAVNTTPYVSGGFYQGGFNGYYGGGVPGFNGITF